MIYDVLHFELSGQAARMLLDPAKDGFVSLPFSVEEEFTQDWFGRAYIHADALMFQLRDADDVTLEKISDTHLVFATMEDDEINFYSVPRSHILTVNVWTKTASDS